MPIKVSREVAEHMLRIMDKIPYLLRNKNYRIPKKMAATKRLHARRIELQTKYDIRRIIEIYGTDNLRRDINVSVKGNYVEFPLIPLEKLEDLRELFTEVLEYSNEWLKECAEAKNKLESYMIKLRSINVKMAMDLGLEFDENEIYEIKGSKNRWHEHYESHKHFNESARKCLEYIEGPDLLNIKK